MSNRKKLKLTLIGKGKMGKTLEALAPKHGFELVNLIDSKTPIDEYKQLNASDVWIDFSYSEGQLERIKEAFLQEIPIVVGTTGWEKDLEKVKELSGGHHSFLFSPNFSPFVYLFMKLSKDLCRCAKSLDPETEFKIFERHHMHKKDAPSGTAKKLKQELQDTLPSETFTLEVERVGNCFGLHQLSAHSLSDKLSLSHTSLSRDHFASGALEAAYWLYQQKGYQDYETFMSHLLQSQKATSIFA